MAEGQAVAPDVCVVGEINPDLILYGLPRRLEPEKEILASGLRLTLGSSSAIFAHNLSALGTRVGMISKVGSDSFGKVALDRLIEGGVDVSHVSKDLETPTGLTIILAQPTSRYILTYPGTIFELRYDDLDFDYILSARHLHIASYFLQQGLRPQVAEIFCAAKNKGLTTSLDTNDDPDDKWEKSELIQALGFVDLLFVNEREAKKITRNDDVNDALVQLSDLCGTLVIKLGAKGAIAKRKSETWRSDALKVDVVDTVGAGDSFDAGYIHRFLQGAEPQECLKSGNAVGAYSTTQEGGSEAFRDGERMRAFLRKSGLHLS